MTIASYVKSYALGHRYLANVLSGEVLVEEKVDGSQFSFGIINGELCCRSKKVDIPIDCPEGMFNKAIEVIVSLKDKLREGYIYRGEYLQKPKHNVLCYSRIPENHIIIFDIDKGMDHYLSYEEKREEANRIGLEVVPVLHTGEVTDIEMFKALLNNVSILGGQKIEGVVIKNYNQFSPEARPCMAKYVSEAFKEVHNGEFRANNPTQGDIVTRLIYKYKTPARWAKAVQHLKESGEIEGAPQDIGKLMKEVESDIFNECAEDIKETLFKEAFPKIIRGARAGFPEWYKEQLLIEAFGENNETI